MINQRTYFSGSVFVGCLPCGCVEVVSDCVLELKGDWVIGCLFASLEAVVNSAVCIRVRTLVFCLFFEHVKVSFFSKVRRIDTE